MREFYIPIIINLIIYAISFGSVYGAIRTKIDLLEKKQDKHNCLVERMVAVEQSSKSAHHRADDISVKIDGLCEKIEELKVEVIRRG